MDLVVFSKKQKKREKKIGLHSDWVGLFCPKAFDDQGKKGLPPTNSDGSCGVLQRINKKKKIRTRVCTSHSSQYRVSAQGSIQGRI